MKKIICLLNAVFAAAVAGEPSANLIVNPGFEEGDKAPLGWTAPDRLTVFWEQSGGNPGKYIRFDTDVYLSEAKKHQSEPDKDVQKTQPVGERYDTVGGTTGVNCWSLPVAVEPGGWYLMEADVKGPGGSPFVYLKGFRELDEKDASGHGTLRFFCRVPGGPAYSELIGGDEQRQARAGDMLQTFRARLVCRVPGDGKWHRFQRTVQIKTEKRYRADVVMLMLYAYWPAGEYCFDNISLRKITEAEAKAAQAARGRSKED